MRIALVTHGLPPERRTGVEVHSAAVARALVRAGHDVLLVAPEEDRARPHLAVRDVEPGADDRPRELRINRIHAPRSSAERDEPPGLRAVLDALWERERPELVHVESAFGLGLAPFESASERGALLVASAHDYAAVCHRVTLLRPDLSRCTTIGDAAACARCDRASARLDAIERLGDHQLGALPEQLEPRERLELARDLERDAPAETEERRVVASARRAAWNACARILVPTAYLRERLVAGGLEPQRLCDFEFGIERASLERLAPPRRAAGEPLRVAYLGGLSKHKGVHVLVDAVLAAETPIELVVAGSSSDAPYREELVRRAAGSDRVRFTGAFDRAELPRLLAGTHVVAVPSTWAENAPFVVREAFAARRPVLASRVGALPESVRDGVDGRLVELDARAWARALDEVGRGPDELARLVGGIRPPRSIDDEARELGEHYDELATERARSGRRSIALPASVRPFAERVAALEHERLHGVVERALAAIDRARREDRVSDAEFAERAGTVLATLVGELDAWAGELRVATAEIAWLRERLDEADERDAWRARGERDVRAELAALRAELEHERERSRSLAAESAWWRARAESAEAAGRELHAALDATRAEARWRRETQDAASAERHGLRTALDDAQAALAALARHERWLREELGALARTNGTPPQPAELPDLLARLAARLGGGRS